MKITHKVISNSLRYDIDPLAEKYYDQSPYVFCGNNPVRYVDKDGRDIIVSQNNMSDEEFNELKNQILTALQTLTNDKLAWKYNTLIIKSLNTENTSEDLSFGTKLIRSQNNKQEGHKTTIIEKTVEGNSVEGASSKVNLNSNGINGIGDNAKIKWNPNSTLGGVDENRNRPPSIGLGHELIHADHMNKGKRDPRSSGKMDGDGTGIILSNEKYNTRIKENKLRQEQKLPLRKQ